MKLTQLSLFLENKPRQLRVPTRLLTEAGVNIETLTLADTQQFGILRLIVADWEHAKRALEEAGCVVNVTEVVALEVADQPGGLDRIMAAIEANDLNVEYMYAFTSRRGESAVLIFRFEDPDAAVDKLQSAGINVLSEPDLLK